MFSAGSAQAADLQGLIDALRTIDFRLEDDSVELHFFDQGDDNILDVGDTLRGIAEFTQFESNDGIVQANLDGIVNTHISAIFEAAVVAKIDNGDGTFDFVFGPSGTLNNPGTMIEFYEDAVDNLAIFNGGATVAICEGTVTDGTLIHELGMTGAPFEFWIALNAPEDTTLGQLFDNTENLGDFNFLLSTIATSLERPNSADPLLNPWRGSGSIQGIGNVPNAGDKFDFVDDAQVGPTEVPEPSTLGLLAFGFAALGLMGMLRRRSQS